MKHQFFKENPDFFEKMKKIEFFKKKFKKIVFLNFLIFLKKLNLMKFFFRKVLKFFNFSEFFVKTSKTGLQRPAARYDGIGIIGGGYGEACCKAWG